MEATEFSATHFLQLNNVLDEEDSDELYDSVPLHQFGNTSGSDAEEILLTTDKHALIRPDPSKEKAPLKEASAHQELICGFDGLRVIIITSLVFAIAVTIGLITSIATGQKQLVSHGAVSTDTDVCSTIGGDMLRRNGHAVDAAVAAAFCLGVVHGHYSGLGGGGFILIGNPITKSVNGFNFREMAPVSSTPQMFENNPKAAVQGGLAVAIPGELLGLETAWKQYGKLPWADLIEPSIHLARDGFKVTPQLAKDISRLTDQELSGMSQNLQNLYRNRKTNDTLQRPSLASLLQQIASKGSVALYNGTVTREIVDMVNSNGGNMATADLKNYMVQTSVPIQSSYNLHGTYSLPAPSSGPAVLATLHTLAGLNLTAPSPTTSLQYHATVEIAKFVAASARGLGDPQQSPLATNLTATMLGEAYAARIRDTVNDTATYEYQRYFEHGQVFQQLYATQASGLISVADNNNNLVSLVSSINCPFGSGLMTESGIILNNAMNSFNWEGKSQIPETTVPPANSIKAGRRPMSNMAPILAWNEENLCTRRMAVGGVDRGSVQAAMVSGVMKLMSLNDTLEASIERRERVLPSLYDNLIEVEDGLGSEVIAGLRSLGHKVQVRQEGLGIVNAASETKDVLAAQSDSRRLGARAHVY